MERIDTAALEVRIDKDRRGVERPEYQIAMELRNITTVLLELLKEFHRRS